MATRPTTTPEWATGGGRRLEPDAGEKADGFVEGERTPARKANWAIGFLCDLAAYVLAIIDSNEEHTYQTPKARVLTISPWQAFGSNAQTANESPWCVQVSGSSPNEGWNLVSRHDFAMLFLPVSELLPTGAELTQIRALVKPGAARGTGDRMKLSWMRHTANFLLETQIFDGPEDEDEDDGTTDIQVLSTGTISPAIAIDKTVNAAAQIVAHLTCGDDAGTNRDRVLAFELTFTDPGPRNV